MVEKWIMVEQHCPDSEVLRKKSLHCETTNSVRAIAIVIESDTSTPP